MRDGKRHFHPRPLPVPTDRAEALDNARRLLGLAHSGWSDVTSEEVLAHVLPGWTLVAQSVVDAHGHGAISASLWTRNGAWAAFSVLLGPTNEEFAQGDLSVMDYMTMATVVSMRKSTNRARPWADLDEQGRYRQVCSALSSSWGEPSASCLFTHDALRLLNIIDTQLARPEVARWSDRTHVRHYLEWKTLLQRADCGEDEGCREAQVILALRE
jgi:hypothetical protein